MVEQVTITVDAGSDAEALRQARMLTSLAESQNGLSVSRPADAVPKPGEKGAGLAFGTLLMALVTSGAVTALINVLKTYFEVNKSISLELARSDGKSVKLSATNFEREELEQTVTTLKHLLADDKDDAGS